ncbi:hypothetical protein GQ53DRAFT_757370 [Thozetella sp. PMI_491]|nr:hypothetical protein GQ53DRAFT_757370 [Thozetella sp. PMI_491]
MSLSALPGELLRLILLAAVKIRSVKRATRLRDVRKLWSVAVLEAIYASGILDDEKVTSPMMWHYVACRALCPLRRMSRPLRIIREVAERLAAHRSPYGICTEQAVRDCVFEICSAPPDGLNRLAWSGEPDTLIQSIDEEDDDFKRAFMAAAV